MSGKDILKFGLLYGFGVTIGMKIAEVVINKVEEKINECDDEK